MYAVKIKPAGSKVFYFFCSGGVLIRRRVHAIMFEEQERAQTIADDIAKHYPTDIVKVVKL